jgi:hypothetical protein
MAQLFYVHDEDWIASTLESRGHKYLILTNLYQIMTLQTRAQILRTTHFIRMHGEAKKEPVQSGRVPDVSVFNTAGRAGDQGQVA